MFPIGGVSFLLANVLKRTALQERPRRQVAPISRERAEPDQPTPWWPTVMEGDKARLEAAAAKRESKSAKRRRDAFKVVDGHTGWEHHI